MAVWSSSRVMLMKHFVTVLALLIPTAASAVGAPKEWWSALWWPTSVVHAPKSKPILPKKFRGDWCPPQNLPDSQKEEGYPYWVRGNCDGDARWFLGRDGFGGHETGCDITSVTKTARGVQVKGRCQSGTGIGTKSWYQMHLNLTLLPRDRLIIKVTKNTQ